MYAPAAMVAGSMAVGAGLTAGERLRILRRSKALSMRSVYVATIQIAYTKANDDFIVTPARLSAIERVECVPSVYKLAALSLVYEVDIREVLSWYGI